MGFEVSFQFMVGPPWLSVIVVEETAVSVMEPVLIGQTRCCGRVCTLYWKAGTQMPWLMCGRHRRVLRLSSFTPP